MRFSNRISHMDTSALRNVLALTARPDIISFAGGLPAPEAFPVEALRRAAVKVLSARAPPPCSTVLLWGCPPCGRSWPGDTGRRGSPARQMIF